MPMVPVVPTVPARALVLAGCLGLVALAVAALVGQGGASGQDLEAPSVGAVGAVGAAGPGGAVAPVPVAPWPEPAGLRAVRVLERWQDDRAAAYSSGDVAALRRLHVRGSIAGRRDVRVLRAYVARGVVLELHTRTDALSVLVARPGRVVVRQRAVVRATVQVAGRTRTLPGQAGWRRVELVRREGRWRLRSATPAPPGSPRVPP